MKNYLAPIAVLLISGCSTSMIAPAQREAENNAALAAQHMETLRAGQKVETRPAPTPQHNNGVYLPVRKLEKHVVQVAKDPILTQKITINRSFVSAQELAERISAIVGIPVVVSPDVQQQNNQVSTSASLPPIPLVPAIGAAPTPITSSQYSTSVGGSGFPLTLSYSGQLSGFLDTASVRLGISWEMKNGQIRFFRYNSKTFRLAALPGDTSMGATVGTTSNSSGGNSGSGNSNSSTGAMQSSSSNQNASVNFTGLSVWKGMEESIKSMLSPAGKVIVSPSLGTITVTDTPVILSEVEEYIEEQNKSLSRQVVVNVRVLSIDANQSNGYGVNWDAFYKNLSSNFGLSLTSNTPSITGAGSLALNVLRGKGTNPWADSNLIIEALSTQANVSTVTSASVTTLNNQPAPIQVGRQTSYIASSSTSITTGVATTSMTSGTVNSGFSMSLLPHIIDGDKMLMQYVVDISSLLALNTTTSGDTVIQTPDLDTRNSLQRVMVRSGDTIVVSGFESTENNAKTQGVLGADNPALGGSVSGKRNKNSLVILIQPLIVD